MSWNLDDWRSKKSLQRIEHNIRKWDELKCQIFDVIAYYFQNINVLWIEKKNCILVYYCYIQIGQTLIQMWLSSYYRFRNCIITVGYIRKQKNLNRPKCSKLSNKVSNWNLHFDNDVLVKIWSTCMVWFHEPSWSWPQRPLQTATWSSQELTKLHYLFYLFSWPTNNNKHTSQTFTSLTTLLKPNNNKTFIALNIFMKWWI